jgi:hypothetical protein
MSCLRQPRKELHSVSRIHVFQKLGDLLPIIREVQDQRVLVCIRSNISLGCARRMHNTRMRIRIMHGCVDGNLSRG